MNTTRRTFMAAASAVLASALALSVSGSVQAQPQPRGAAPGFLAAKDMPPAEGIVWSAGEVTRGEPEFEPFCLESVLPAQGAVWHRQFGTEYDTWGIQVTVRAASARGAERLATSAGSAAADCAADWLRANPGSTAAWDDYGPLPVEEGAHVYGVHTAPPDAGTGVHLLGIGRDGNTVTMVQWAQMGNLSHAPVAAFKKTTTTAVNKLR